MEVIYLPIIVPIIFLNIILLKMLVKERKKNKYLFKLHEDVRNECLEVKKDINYLHQQIKKL